MVEMQDMPSYLSETDFFIHPINFHKGNDQAPLLSHEKTTEIVVGVSRYIDSASIDELKESGCVYWLTHALHCATASMNIDDIKRICTVMHKLAVKYPGVLMLMLDEVIDVTDYLGQHATYVWLNHLYLATFDTRNYEATDTTIISIQYIISSLLKNATQPLALSLTKVIEQGQDIGKHALFIIAQALVQTAKKGRHPPTTFLIAELLDKHITQSPDILGLAATQDIQKGNLEGKSVVYMMAYALRYAVVDNSNASALIIKDLCIINREHHKALINCLCRVIELGPHAGLHSLNVILTALVSASYIMDNTEMVQSITGFIKILIDQDPDRITSVLKEKITSGEYLDKNGIMMLERAASAALTHGIDADPINALISQLNSTALAKTEVPAVESPTIIAQPILYDNQLDKKSTNTDVSDPPQTHGKMPF